ncbi:MAG: SRPBCC domain-containing protein [Bacteroidota bacterium]|nr:SRPBCC domain-containing protein [Bacteroidota bacterium]
MKLTHLINKPVEVVFSYLTDMQKFTSVHPVISKINHLYSNTYMVYETLNFGFVPISFTYPVTVESDFDKKIVIIKAKVMGMSDIKMTFVLSDKKNRSLIDESIEISSILPIKSIIQNIFKKQHLVLFQNIENQ